MKTALVIYNPVSGSKKWRDVPSLIQRLLKSQHYEWIWHETQRNQDLRPLFSRSYDRIVVAGGDGTVAEVVSGMVQEKIKTPLVILPQGSGNLLARALGIPIVQTGKALLEGLKEKGQQLDVICVNNRHYGLIAAGRGYDTFLMGKTSRFLKQKFGFFAYVWTFLRTILFYRKNSYKLTIDKKRIYVMARAIIVFNISPLPIPNTPILPNDGLLNLFLFTHPVKIMHLTGKTIVIKAKKESKFEMDGEVLKSRTIKIEVLPKAIFVVFKKQF